jgi:hypothetical protein
LLFSYGWPSSALAQLGLKCLPDGDALDRREVLAATKNPQVFLRVLQVRP